MACTEGAGLGHWSEHRLGRWRAGGDRGRHWGVALWGSSSWCGDPDPAGGRRARFAAALEGLDDDHGSAAARAGLGEGRRLVARGNGFSLVLWCRQVEQLTHSGKVLGASAIGKEPVMSDAVEARGQDVDG